MAFGLRYYNEFTSDHFKRTVRIEISERDYIGASEQIKMGASLHLSDSGDGREEPIKKLTASLRMVSERNFQFEHLFTSDDRKYKVEIYRKGAIIFRGFLESDSYSEPYYTWKNYTVNLTARDNLGRLEDIPYLMPNGDRVTGLESANNIVQRAINNVGYSVNIFDFIDTWSSDMSTLSTTMSQAYINNDAFWNFEDNEPLSCLDVLTNIVQGFGSQIRQIAGAWRIVDQAKYHDRPTVQGNSASFPDYLAEILNFPKVITAFDWISSDADMTILPAWKEFSLEQDYNVDENIFRFFPFDTSGIAITSTQRIGTAKASSIDNWTLSGGQWTLWPKDMNIHADLGEYAESSLGDFETDDLSFEFKATYNVISIGATGLPNSSAFFDIISNGSQILTDSGWVAYVAQEKQLELDTTPAGGDLTVVFDVPQDGEIIIKVWGPTDGLNATNLATYYSMISVKALSSRFYNDQELIAEIDSKNNLENPPVEINIGQVDEDNNSDIIYLGGLFTSAGVAQVDWKRDGDTTAENLLKKVAIGYDLQNKQPSRQVNGTVLWDYDLWTNIDDQNKRLMINACNEWDMVTDQMSAEWVEVFEYVNTLGEFDLGYDDNFDNNTVDDYSSNTIFTITEKTE